MPPDTALELKFFARIAGGTFGVLAGATVKNFDTLWRYRQAGQTAPSPVYWQVGRPSKFLPQSRHMPNMAGRQAEGGHQK